MDAISFNSGLKVVIREMDPVMNKVLLSCFSRWRAYNLKNMQHTELKRRFVPMRQKVKSSLMKKMFHLWSTWIRGRVKFNTSPLNKIQNTDIAWHMRGKQLIYCTEQGRYTGCVAIP